MVKLSLSLLLAVGFASASVVITGRQVVTAPPVQDSAVSTATRGSFRELLVNPGFETGQLAPWYTSAWVIDSGYPHKGRYCAADVGNYWIRQDIDTTPATLITSITFWARQPDQPAAQAFDFFYSDGSYEEFVHFPTPSWQQFDVTAHLNRSKSLVGFRLWGYSGGGPGPDSTYVDDVSIQVPGFHDMGVTALLYPVDTIPLDTPVVPLARVRNFGTEPESIPVRMRIEDICAAVVWLDTVWVAVLPGAEVTVPFDTWQPVSPGLHRATTWVTCVGDTVTGNDTLSQLFWVRSGQAVEQGALLSHAAVPTVTVMTAAGLRRLAAPTELFNVTGQQVRDIRPGMYFLMSTGRLRKVVVVR